MSRIKNYIFTFVGCVLVLCVLFAIIEIASPIFLPVLNFSALPDEVELRDLEENFQESTIPNLFWIPRPDTEFFNSLGFSDQEYPVEKDDDVVRIIALGDSVTQGWWRGTVRREELYPTILENRLGADETLPYTYEVWNAGVGKYNTMQEFLYFKHYVLQYQPDIVILGYLELQDYDLPRLRYDEHLSLAENCYIAMVPKLLPISDRAHTVLSRSNAYKVINMGIYDLFGRVASETFPPIVFKSTESYQAMVMNRKALFDIKKICDHHNIHFLLVVFPELIDRDMSARDQWIYTVPKHAGIETIYLLPHFLAEQNNVEAFQDSSGDTAHPNMRAHAIAAEQIESRLRSLQWLHK